MLSIWQKIMEKITKSVKQQDNPRDKDVPSLPVLRAELQIPQTIIDRYDASHHKNDTREWWRLVIDGGAFIFAVLGFYILYRTLVITQQTLETTREAVVAAQTEARAAVSAAEIAGKQMELSERPWISAEVIIPRPITFNRNRQTEVTAQVTVKNTGHSVAANVWEKMQIVFLPHVEGEELVDAFWEAEALQKRLCEEVREMVDGGRFGFVLFPEQYLPLSSAIPVPKEDVEGRVFTQPEESGLFVNPLVIGCVAYRAVFAPDYHVTGFAYSVSSLVQTGGYFRVDETVTAESIRTRPEAFANVYID